MFSLNKIHDNAFGGIGNRYAHFIDPYHFLGRNALDEALWNSPKAKSNVSKKEDHYQIEIATPGFSKEEVAINLVDERLVIECTKTQPQDKVSSQIHQEYGHNQISRSFVLPKEVDKDGITSQYRNGLLTINLPVREATVRSITVG